MPRMIDDDFDESEMFGSEAGIASPRPVAAASSGNPLAGYFRMPGLSVPLPTGGRFFPAGSIDLDAKGQVSVFPMRGSDEMLLKSPDALMSGLAVEKLIESCVPGIKLPHLVTSPDLDVLLLAIRAASLGNQMPIEVACPKCEHAMAFDVDLGSVLATMKPMPDNIDLRISADMVIVMQPHTLSSQTKLLLAAYEEQRRAMAAEEMESEEEKQQVLRGTLKKIQAFQNESLADAITKVSVPGSEVTDRKYILEFVTNAPRDLFDKIRHQVELINSMGIDRSIHIKCEKCTEEWKSKIEFNPATFFAPSSSD